VTNIRFNLQDRDVEIIKQVYKHRFLNSEHIRALIPGSNQNILRRLQALYHNHYLDRPREQIQPYRAGSQAMIYGLGNKGADLLTREFDVPRAKVDWTSKNKKVQTFFLKHTLLISDFMVFLELACRQAKNIKIIEPEEILSRSPAENQKRINPYALKIETIKTTQREPKEIKIGLVPDKVFGLHFTDEPKGKNKAYFFLEADRSTMPIIRKSFSKTSFFKKLFGYYIASHLQENIFEKTFGFKYARVLTITKSEDRIRNMLEANKVVDKKRKGIRMFLFAKASDFDLENNNRVLEKIWRNGRDEIVSLID
jgi:hypothetical protein